MRTKMNPNVKKMRKALRSFSTPYRHDGYDTYVDKTGMSILHIPKELAVILNTVPKLLKDYEKLQAQLAKKRSRG